MKASGHGLGFDFCIPSPIDARRGGGKATSEGSKPARRKGGFSFSSFKRGKKKADGTKEVTFATSSTTDSAVNATNQV